MIDAQMKEGTRAQVEKGHIDLVAMQSAIEGRLRMRELLSQESQAQQGEPPL